MIRVLDLFYWKQFLLALIRMLAFVSAMPYLSNPAIDIKVKITFALFLTIIVFPLLPYNTWIIPSSLIPLTFLIFKEIMVGVVLGFVVNLVFMSIIVMGELLGYQIGFTMATMVDPMSSMNNNILTIFSFILATTLFLAINGHYYFIWGMKESFIFIPPGLSLLKVSILNYIVLLIKKIFVIAVRIGAPAIATVLFVDITLGFIGKLSPKVQIIFVGFPLKIVFGLIALSFIFSISLNIWKTEVNRLPDVISKIFLYVR